MSAVASGLVEVEDAVHVAVVGDADRRLPVGRRLGHDVLDPRRAVEHRVLGVQVQVDERAAHVLAGSPNGSSRLVPGSSTGLWTSLWTNHTV